MNSSYKFRNYAGLFLIMALVLGVFFMVTGLNDQVQAQGQDLDNAPGHAVDSVAPRQFIPGVAIPPAEERYPAKYPMVLSASPVEGAAPNVVDAPVFDIWYGDTQIFGTPGQSQKWVNILGNVTGASSLSYSLNGGPATPLSIGPDLWRLTASGDFNVEIDYADLNVGDNSLVLTANALNREIQATKAVTIKYQPSSAPLPFNANWDPSIQADAQIVEGKWSVADGEIRPDELGYDRLVLVGDSGWSFYEVTVPVTVHAIDLRGFDDNASRPNIGVVMRWQGHFEEDGEGHPYVGWKDLGALALYEWYLDNTVSLRLIGFGGDGMGSSLNTDLAYDTEYMFKMSAQPVASGPAYYRYKFWPSAEPEPLAWDIEAYGKEGEPAGGSFGLQGHFVDVSYGEVVAKPIAQIKPVLTVTPPTNGTVTVTPLKASYDYGEKVTLTPTAALGYKFVGWGGEASGNDEPLILYMTKDTTVAATFADKNAPIVTITQGANGQATVDPDKPAYTFGETVRFSALPNAGYQLYDWGGDLGGIVNPFDVMVTDDILAAPTYGPLRSPLSDDFNTCQLDTSVWTFDNRGDNLSTYRIVDDEKLEIFVPGGTAHDLWTGTDAAPRIMQAAEDRDMDLVAKFDSPVSIKYQIQGILVEGADGAKVRADFGSDNTTAYIFAATVVSGTATQKLGIPITPPAGSSLFVRLTRVGAMWTVSHKFDGGDWIEDGAFPFIMEVQKAGIFAGNTNPNPDNIPPHTAVADYFFNTAAPVEPEDGSARDLPVTIVGLGTVERSPEKTDYACGEEIALTATPIGGGEFLNWSGSITGTVSPATLTYNIGDAVTATFSDEPTNALTVTVQGNGNVSKNPDLTNYPVDSTVTLTATADAGWTFKEWQGDVPAGSTNPTLVLTMDSDKSVTALFVEAYSLAVTTEGQGSVTKAPDQAAYPADSQVTLTAVAESGWAFKQWEGDDVPVGSTDPTLVLTMNSDKTVKAIFEEAVTYTLTVNTQGDGSVTKAPDLVAYPEGSQATLTATADSDWKFREWQGDVPDGSTNPTLVLTMDSDKTVTAIFDEAATKSYLPWIRSVD